MRCIPFLLLTISLVFARAQHFSTDDVQLIDEIDKHFSASHVDYGRIIPKLKARFPEQLLIGLDPEAIYLTKADADGIRHQLGEFQVGQHYTRQRLESIRMLFEKRLNITLATLESLGEINFFEDDSIFFDTKSDTVYFHFAEEELKRQWVTKFKYEVLLASSLEDSLLRDKPTIEVNAVLNQQVAYQVESTICYLYQLLEEDALTKYVLLAYLKAYCQSFDPHSDFLSIQEDNEFTESLSSESYGTGIRVRKAANKLIISEIIPFSYASFDEKLKVGDEITRIEVDGQLMTPVCLPLEKLTEFFYGDRNSKITVEVKSNEDFSLRKITLSKSIVNNSLNHTYSYILQNEMNRIGYIQFPSFYAAFGPGDRSAAQDLALILLKLKKEEVDGVILDLRNNGGGSVAEAKDLLGYFIDYGPLFTIANKEYPEGRLVKDTKKGRVIDTKVIFLVNSLSASASEMVAARMQKYPGSLVVGSQTFGKGTGQILMPVKAKFSSGNQGVISVTNIKTYRFDGSNYQGEGVIPDIVLPSILSKAIVGEDHYPYVLKLGKRRKFRQVRFRDEPIDSLRDLSRKRGALASVEQISVGLEGKLTSEKGISLNYSAFRNPYEAIQNLSFKAHDYFDILSMEEDEAFTKESQRIIVLKQKDPILKETFQILEDWIRISN